MIPGVVAHLCQSTVFAGVAWLVVLVLRKNPAHVRYWVWFTASAKFLVPFSLLVGFGALAPRHVGPAAPVTWVATAERIGQPLTTFSIVAAPSSQSQRNYLAEAGWFCGPRGSQ